jgi:hypothetical protein
LKLHRLVTICTRLCLKEDQSIKHNFNNYELAIQYLIMQCLKKITILESITAFAINFPRNLNLFFTFESCPALADLPSGLGYKPTFE